MRVHDLFNNSVAEARSNPHLNTAGKFSNAPQDINSFKGEPDLFLSMTDIPKIGINPKSVYSTPIGVYAYPLDSRRIWLQIDHGRLPHGNEAPFRQVLKLTSNKVLRLDSVATGEEKRVRDGLERLIDPYFGSVAEIDEFLDKASKPRFIASKPWSEEPVDTPGARIWNMTGFAAALIASEKVQNGRLDIFSREDHETIMTARGKVAWNVILRRLGYEVVIDRDGIIHENEPEQAVFLNTSSFTLLARLDNPHRVVKNRQELTTFSSVFKLWRNGRLSVDDVLEVFRSVGRQSFVGKKYFISPNFRDKVDDASVNTFLDEFKTAKMPARRNRSLFVLLSPNVAKNLSSETKERITDLAKVENL